jgi:hypothetical protein
VVSLVNPTDPGVVPRADLTPSDIAFQDRLAAAGALLKRSQGTALWQAGVGVLKSGVSPADVKAAIDALVPTGAAFITHKTSGENNETGDDPTLQTFATHTEIVDVGGDVDSGGVFTAPVTGYYQLSGGIYWSTDDVWDVGLLAIATSNRTYQIGATAAGTAVHSVGMWSISVLADMDASDTAELKFRMDGAAGDTFDALEFFFSGHRIFS